MIIGTLTVLMLIFGGGGMFSFDAIEPVLKEQIADEQRLEQMLDVVKKANDVVKDFQKQLRKDAKEAVKINQNYVAERGDFRTLFNRGDERRLELQKKLIESRFKLKELMTREEWEAVFAEAKEEGTG